MRCFCLVLLVLEYNELIRSRYTSFSIVFLVFRKYYQYFWMFMGMLRSFAILVAHIYMHVLGVEYLQNSTAEMVDRVPWVDLQIMMQKWTRQVEVAVKVLYAGERRLACQVFRDLGQPVWVECSSHVAQPGMTAFLQSERVYPRAHGLLKSFASCWKWWKDWKNLNTASLRCLMGKLAPASDQDTERS